MEQDYEVERSKERMLKILHELESLDVVELAKEIELVKIAIAELLDEIKRVKTEEKLKMKEEVMPSGVQLEDRLVQYEHERRKKLKYELPYWSRLVLPIFVGIVVIALLIAILVKMG